MKTLLEKQTSLKSMVEVMGDLKNETSNRGKELHAAYRDRCQTLIEELRAEGVSEDSHPIFKNAVASFNYWK